MIHKRVLILSILLFLFGVIPFPGYAVDMIVNDSSPYVNANGRCSLIEAIDNANDDAPTHTDCLTGSGADVIILSRNISLDGTDIFSGGVDGDTGLPTITSDLTIDGNGLRIRRTGSASDFRILHVSAGGDLTLNNVTIRNGRVSNGFENGGGIMNHGELTLINSVVRNNHVMSIFPQGGGIYNSSTGILTIIDSTIADNSVANPGTTFHLGGAIYSAGELTLLNTTIENNSSDLSAGGIYTFGNTHITNSQFINNTAGVNGGALYLSTLGGATIDVNSSVFSGNTAIEAGGAIVNVGDGVDIFGSTFDSNIVEGNPNAFGGAIYNIATMEIVASLFNNNQAQNNGYGGAIYNSGFGSEVILTGSTISNNSSGFTGGGLLTASGAFYVEDSLIIGNIANSGGGLSLRPSNSPLGFYVERTTVMNNTAEFMGGGYYAEGNQTSSTIVNSTFTGNESQLIGGGIGLNAGGQVDLLNSTVVDNSSTNFTNSVGGVNAFAGTMTTGNTIIANNVNVDCSATNASTSLDNNLTTGTGGGAPVVDRWCSFIPLQPNDQVDTDPLLESLAYNGNVGPTFLLQVASPAIDAILSDCPPELNGIDQRGVPRGSGTCDVGAIANETVILPEVYFETASTTIDDEGTVTTTQNVNLVVDNTNGTLSAPGSLPLTIFVTQRGTATDVVDYSPSIATPLIYTFDAGSWVATGNSVTLSIPINVIDDLIAESDETIEFELTVIGPGVLIANQSTHVVTIIDDDRVNNSSVTDADEETDNPTPDIDIFDPAISKLGLLLPGQLGVLGEKLRWDVTVTNRGSVAGSNVVVSDTLRPELQIDDVTTSKGTIDVTGQTVTVNIPTLAAGEQVNIAIFTTSLDGTIVLNTACVNADNQLNEQCVSALPIQSLPNTGQTPWWRTWLLMIIGFGAMMGLSIRQLGTR
jgi:predicted outer membrane repeat protein